MNDIKETLYKYSSLGQLDALINELDSTDLISGLLYRGDFFDIIRRVGQRAISGNCRADGPSGGLFFRHIEFDEVGQSEVLHKHAQPHCALVMSGKAMVRTWDKDYRLDRTAAKLSEVVVTTRARVNIPNNVYHEFMCLEAPYFHFCIFPMIDSETGKVIYDWDGSVKAYC